MDYLFQSCCFTKLIPHLSEEVHNNTTLDEFPYEKKPNLTTIKSKSKEDTEDIDLDLAASHFLDSNKPKLLFRRSNCSRPADIQYETSDSYMLKVPESKNKGSPPSSPTNPLSTESFNNFVIPTLTIKKSLNPFYKSMIASDNELEEEEEEEEEDEEDEKEETESDEDEHLFASDIVDVIQEQKEPQNDDIDSDPESESESESDLSLARDIMEESKEALMSMSKMRASIKDSMQNAKKRYIEQEIIETEESYYHGLDVLFTDIIQPMFDEKYIEHDKYYDIIRSSLPEMKQFHLVFLKKLSDENRNKSVANAFNTFIGENKEKFIKMYIKFISEYNQILDLFGSTFHDNVELKTFLKQKRKEKKPLSNFLILPVQRVPRYILLLEDLKKNTMADHPDYRDINNALLMVTEITEKVNEGQRKIENLSQCLSIQHSLNGLKEPIVSKSGETIHVDNWMQVREIWWNKKQFLSHIEVLDVKKSKGFK